jgi:MFS family permease
MGLSSLLRVGHRDDEGLLKKQKLNGYTILILCTLGLGSLTYGQHLTSITAIVLTQAQATRLLSLAQLWVRHNCSLRICTLLIITGQPSFITYFELDTRPNRTDLIASTNGLFQTGGTLGTLCLPWFADKYGRKWACAVVSSRSGSMARTRSHLSPPS